MALDRNVRAPLNTDSPSWLASLMEQKRAGRLQHAPSFWVAAERLPLLQAVYPGCDVEPWLVPPDSETKRHWEHEEAVRELVRGRMEVSGPVSRLNVAELLHVPESDIEIAMLSLEGEGFILRGKFHPGAEELECV